VIQTGSKNDSVTALDSRQNTVTESSVNVYRPTGTARGSNSYYRFSYKRRDRVRHVHIPGGNTGSPLAHSRAIEVGAKAAAEVPAAEIVEMIRRWSAWS
jgi:hypothetical protein